jgi:hypothetical protein
MDIVEISIRSWGEATVADSKDQHPEFDDLNLSSEEPDFNETTDLDPSSDGLADSGELAVGDQFVPPQRDEAASDSLGESGSPFEMGTSEAIADEAVSVEAAEAVATEDAGADQPFDLAAVGASAADGGEPAGSLAEDQPRKGSLAWLAYVEWVGVALVVTAVYLLFSLWSLTSDNVMWHAIYWVLMGLVPYVLWKTRRLWKTPEITAPYTIMLAIGVMALTTAVYFLGLELAEYKWDLKAKTAKTLTAAPVVAQPVNPVAKKTP